MLRHVFAMPATSVLLVLLAFALVIIKQTVAHSQPTVRTEYGWVRGVQQPGVDGGPYEAFYGIPFAKPPTKMHRFANPRFPSSWTGVLNVTEPKPDCIQKNSLLSAPTVTGDEDCLYLNLYRPLNSEQLPVIVFIHGGAFFSGSPGPAILGPQYFMNTGQVIFVTIAYRLGVFGFLSTGDAHSPGNFALKDQTMALRWVHRNVRYFGGNKDSVTIMGVSAGAASVHLHMMSPLSKRYFHRAVSMSGNALGPYNIPTPDPLELAHKQAAAVGIEPQDNTRDLVAKLRDVPARDLVDSIDKLKYWSVDPLTLYRLVVERPSSRSAFLTEDPVSISKNGGYYQVPWLQGTVQNDGAIRAAAILANTTLVAELNEKLDELLPKLMELQATDLYSLPNITAQLKERYLKGMDTITGNEQGFIDMYSDRAFNVPLHNSIYDFVRTSADINQTPVYLYKFNFKGPISFAALITNKATDYGVVHLDDTIYLFQTAFWPPFPADSPFGQLTRTLVQYYVDFAVTGRPTDLGELKDCTFKTMNSISFCDYYMFENSETEDGYAVRVTNNIDYAMLRFWEDIISEPIVKD